MGVASFKFNSAKIQPQQISVVTTLTRSGDMKLILTSTLLFLAFSPSVQADHDRSDQSNRKHSHGAFNTKVMNATPVYKYLTDRHPQHTANQQ
jgi:hypothetical protein